MAATKELTEGLWQEFVKEINAILYEDVLEEILQKMIDNAKHKFSWESEKAKKSLKVLTVSKQKFVMLTQSLHSPLVYIYLTWRISK